MSGSLRFSPSSVAVYHATLLKPKLDELRRFHQTVKFLEIIVSALADRNVGQRPSTDAPGSLRTFTIQSRHCRRARAKLKAVQAQFLESAQAFIFYLFFQHRSRRRLLMRSKCAGIISSACAVSAADLSKDFEPTCLNAHSDIVRPRSSTLFHRLRREHACRKRGFPRSSTSPMMPYIGPQLQRSFSTSQARRACARYTIIAAKALP